MSVYDARAPYNDRFDLNKRYERLLYNPGRPLFQSELNESQSNLLAQLQLQGDTHLQNGTMLSGMSLVYKGSNNQNQNQADTNENLFDSKTLQAIGTDINTDSYADDGEVSITDAAEENSDSTGVQLSYPDVGTIDTTLSFTITRNSGNLENIGLKLGNGTSVRTAKVDGTLLQSDLTNVSGVNLTDVAGNDINLSDGNSHQFTITFSNTAGTDHIVQLLYNVGYNALTDGSANITLDYVKVEKGENVTPWILSPDDKNLAGSNNRSEQYEVSDGLIYFDGMIRVFNHKRITTTNKGDEYIGVKLVHQVITADDDQSLLDHTQGAESEYAKGADRLQYTLQLTYNDPTALTIYHLKNGNIVGTSNSNDNAALYKLLARRTYDQSGSFRVRGLNLWSKPDKDMANRIDVQIDAGTAYVLGYEIDKGGTTTLPIPTASGTATTNDEASVYTGNENNNTVNLVNQPVKEVNNVSGEVRVTGEPVTRNTDDQLDTLNHDGVYNVILVYTEGPDNKKKTVFSPGTDYEVVGEHSLKWNISDNGTEPPEGGTYYVDYTYEKTFERNTDYNVVTKGSHANQNTTIQFTDSGDQPAYGSLVHVNYTYFLAREDTITLDKQGNFHDLRGQQAPLSEVNPPFKHDPLTLQVGYVIAYPNSQDAICHMNSVTRTSFTGIRDLQMQVLSLQHSMAIMAMENAAMAHQDPTELSGVFSDDFSGLDKGDVTNKDFNVEYGNHDITIHPNAQGAFPLNLDQSNTDAEIWNQDALGGSQNTVLISQPYASKAININPYDVVNVLGALSIDPQIDNWTDASNTIADNGDHQITLWDYLKDHFTMQDEGSDNENAAIEQKLESWGVTQQEWDEFYNNHINSGYDDMQSQATIDEGNGTTHTDYHIIQYARTRTIHFDATNLEPDADNLQISIDNINVPATPAPGFESGSNDGTVKANGDGEVKGSFVIPNHTVRTGTRQVKIENHNNTAYTSYTSHGTYDHSYTSHGYVTINIEADPLAESFTVNHDTMLTGVNLYFASKNLSDSRNSRADVVVQLRDLTDDNYPGQKVYSQTTLHYGDIKTSDNGSVPTFVKFDRPVFASAYSQYSIVLLTANTQYELWTATEGGQDINTNRTIMSQPYLGGTLFESSNNQQWTPNQQSDLKFDVFQAGFQDTPTILQFEPIYPSAHVFTDANGKPVLDSKGNKIPMSFTDLWLTGSQTSPDNTQIAWQIRYIPSDASDKNIEDYNWQPYGIGQDFRPNKDVYEFQLRASLYAYQNISPDIEIDSLTLVAEQQSDNSTYLSKNIDMSRHPFNYIHASYQAYLPQNASAQLQYSTDEGDTWHQMTDPQLTAIDRHFVQYDYHVLTHNEAKGNEQVDKDIKFRIFIQDPNVHTRPFVRRFMSSMSMRDASTNTGNHE